MQDLLEIAKNYLKEQLKSDQARTATKNMIARKLLDMGKRKGFLKRRFEVFKRDDFKCVYCGRSSQEGAQLQVDHIHPRKYGGDDSLKNLVTACVECNLGKKDFLLNERQQEKFGKKPDSEER